MAIKSLDRSGVQGSKDFLSEVFKLSLVSHPSLVNLIGYCADGDQRMLVHEFMANGSLENRLLGKLSDQGTLSLCHCITSDPKHLHSLYIFFVGRLLSICTNLHEACLGEFACLLLLVVFSSFLSILFLSILTFV